MDMQSGFIFRRFSCIIIPSSRQAVGWLAISGKKVCQQNPASGGILSVVGL